MANAVMQSPDFSGFDNFAPPFGLILYYIFAFLIMVILLNILIALYNSAYEDITVNAIDEYMALLDEHITTTQAMSFSAFKGPFEESIDAWNETLNTVSEMLDEWIAARISASHVSSLRE